MTPVIKGVIYGGLKLYERLSNGSLADPTDSECIEARPTVIL